ncbi:MAG: hypothetical protein PF570_08775 [Candidatus Cloacimonetes bacterium]|jgi:hypothetical protein|nr:hypothetical protein [Candidatus Cloacimonadota bacterium]
MKMKFTLLIIIITFATCTSGEIYRPKIPVSELQENTPREIALELFQKYLEYYVASEDTNMKLSEFLILSVDTPKLWDVNNFKNGLSPKQITKEELFDFYEMVIHVSYSVKPTSKPTSNPNNIYWLAGNGHFNEGESWIHSKAAYVFIKRIDDNFVIDRIGTGI